MKWWHVALIISFLLAVLSPLASSSPDGLEKVAENHGFLGQAHEAPYQIIADYVFPGIENEAVATILAGQTAGAGLASVVAPAKIVVGTSTADLSGREGEVMRKMLPYILVLVLLISLLTAAGIWLGLGMQP